MKEPRRLIESSEDEVGRLLLRAGRERVPSPRGAKRRALAAATGMIAASTLTAGKATGATIAGKAAAGAKAASIVSLKWLVVAGVASVGMVAGTVAVQHVRAERAASVGATAAGAAASKPSVSVARPSSVRSALPAPSAVPVPVLAPVPVAVAAPVSAPVPVRPSSPAKPATSSGSTSAAELTMLDQARGAIARGDSASGLSVLDAYATRFPHPVMGPEASILRIEALTKAGDLSAAKREGDAFLRANPASPYAARVRTLLGMSNP